ncbi:hypothetical protein EYF80_060904 [Liparis tanakae]|uniref:Uncharacterized protein n=1 Tax=Liparis tanakae TaxID=230148 RepID=A0A4Z2EJK0_9TELE|nr:hypothetical protein EYF80_060904 [Liparis tanakae]
MVRFRHVCGRVGLPPLLYGGSSLVCAAGSLPPSTLQVECLECPTDRRLFAGSAERCHSIWATAVLPRVVLTTAVALLSVHKRYLRKSDCVGCGCVAARPGTGPSQHCASAARARRPRWLVWCFRDLESPFVCGVFELSPVRTLTCVCVSVLRACLSDWGAYFSFGTPPALVYLTRHRSVPALHLYFQ